MVFGGDWLKIGSICTRMPLLLTCCPIGNLIDIFIGFLYLASVNTPCRRCAVCFC